MKLCMGCMEYYDDKLLKCPNCDYDDTVEPDNTVHMEPGTVLCDRYIIGRVIGFGGFGVTYIGRDALLDIKVAVKEYLPSEFSTRMLGQQEVTVFGGDKEEQFRDGMKKFIEEAKKLAKFHSTPGIVKIFESFEYNNTAYIVMELLEGETLSELLKREKTIPEDRAISMMIPIIESLEAVHKEGIIHRDIAPDNIFVTKKGDIKLIDFGAARYATTTYSRSLTVIIKPGFSPEEQYRSRGDQGPYTDVYAVAATLYKMITGQTPPDSLERRAYYENKRKDILAPLSKYIKDIDENHETAILNALNIRIEDRTPDMQTFLSELKSTEPVKRNAGRIKRFSVAKLPLWAKVSMISAAGVVALVTILLLTGVMHIKQTLNGAIEVPEGYTRVLSVVNSDYNEGEERLKQQNLMMEIQGKEPSEVIPENIIISQEIDEGVFVKENTVIGVKVSASVIKQSVPDVVGLTIGGARDILEELGFTVATEMIYDDVVSENSVVSQSAEAYSEIPENSEIVLKVSKGRDPNAPVVVKDVVIPSFIGVDYNEVIKEAREKGITIKVNERKYSKDFAKNQVMQQNPASGSKIKNTQAVELVVSLGYEKIKVPSVTLLTEEKAKSLLTGKGLVPKVEYINDETVAAGLVISQDPKENSMIYVESTVVIKVSKGASSFTMPSVLNLSEEDASSELASKGLQVTVNYEQNNSKPEGEVIAQSVKAGSNVKRGDQVIITVCTHSSTVEVPSVSGLTQSEAEREITQLGLTVSVNSIYSDTVDRGRVISQSPAAGSSLKKNDTVVIKVSNGPNPEKTTESSENRESTVSSNVVTSRREESPSSKEAANVSSENRSSAAPESKTPRTIEPDSVKMNINIITLLVGESQGLTAEVMPSNAADKTLTWSSSDSSVVKVSSKGLITAVGEGTAYITTETKNGVSDSCKVIVSYVTPESVEIRPDSLTMKPGESRGLSAVVGPGDAKDKSVYWYSNDSSVVTVTDKGFVTAVAPGEATITAETSNGLKAVCNVTVEGDGNDDPNNSEKDDRDGTVIYVKVTGDQNFVPWIYCWWGDEIPYQWPGERMKDDDGDGWYECFMNCTDTYSWIITDGSDYHSSDYSSKGDIWVVVNASDTPPKIDVYDSKP